MSGLMSAGINHPNSLLFFNESLIMAWHSKFECVLLLNKYSLIKLLDAFSNTYGLLIHLPAVKNGKLLLCRSKLFVFISSDHQCVNFETCYRMLDSIVV